MQSWVFLHAGGGGSNDGKPSSSHSSNPEHSGSTSPAIRNGYSLVAHSLARLGVKLMYGVIGIPVTELASAAQVQK